MVNYEHKIFDGTNTKYRCKNERKMCTIFTYCIQTYLKGINSPRNIKIRLKYEIHTPKKTYIYPTIRFKIILPRQRKLDY